MEMAVIMKRGKARLDESEGATAVRTDRLSCGVQRFRREVSGSRAEQMDEWRKIHFFCTAHAGDGTSHQGG